MAEIPFVLLVVLLLNSAATEDLPNHETNLKSESKSVESKIRAPRHPIAIKQSASTTTSNSARRINQEEKLAQESVEHPRRGPVQGNNYDFGYAVDDTLDGHQFRQEQMTDDGTVHGRFGYRDTKGMFRQVDYLADDYGFRANIRTNEPGTMDLDPANVDIHRIQYVKEGHQPQQPRHAQQVLKTSAVKQENHDYHPEEDEDYQDSYESDSKSEDDEEKNSQSVYDDSETSPKNHHPQIPKKHDKAVIYQYFHKKHMAPHGKREHPATSSDHQNVNEDPSHQQPPHYDISVAVSNEHDEENLKKIPHLTISGLPQPIHHEMQAEHISPKYEENEEVKMQTTPQYSNLLKERVHHGQPHTFTYDPKPPHSDVNNYPVQIKDNHNPSVIHEHIRQGIPYNNPIKAQLFHEKMNPNEHNNHQRHTYVHNKHPIDSLHIRHPTHFYPPGKYMGNAPFENINARHHGPAYISPQQAEVHHHGLVRDSTYRQPLKSIPQEIPIKVNKEPAQRPFYRNIVKGKDQHNEHLSLSNYPIEPKYPVKVIYTPVQNPKTDSPSSYQTPIHKNHFQEEIVYGFPIDKHIADYNNYEPKVNHPSYENPINETEEIQNLDTTAAPYPNTYQKQETTSPNLQQMSKTYLIVHQKYHGPQSDQKQHVKLTKDFMHPKKEERVSLQRANGKAVPKFAVLFDPSVFKHFDKFRISGKSNTDESKWIPIIPQIKWLPQSAPPSTDWIPMTSRNIRRHY